MNPQEAAEARVELLLISRLVGRHHLTADEATIAVGQHHRRETGPHTDLVAAEARALLDEGTAAIRRFLQALPPVAKAAAAAAADLERALQPVARPAAGRRRDRPTWASPYGPPPRRR